MSSSVFIYVSYNIVCDSSSSHKERPDTLFVIAIESLTGHSIWKYSLSSLTHIKRRSVNLSQQLVFLPFNSLYAVNEISSAEFKFVLIFSVSLSYKTSP